MPGLVENSLQLNWSDQDGMVTITPRDENRFAIKIRRAVELLQIGDKIDEFKQQFQLLHSILIHWGVERQDVSAAYLTMRDGSLAFVVIRNVTQYDEDFEDSLSDLDIAIANDADLDLIRLHTLSLPLVSEEAVASFLDPAFTFHYFHGNSS